MQPVIWCCGLGSTHARVKRATRITDATNQPTTNLFGTSQRQRAQRFTDALFASVKRGHATATITSCGALPPPEHARDPEVEVSV
jgi:hypothetical protein